MKVVKINTVGFSNFDQQRLGAILQISKVSRRALLVRLKSNTGPAAPAGRICLLGHFGG